jgi:hypothetical protein
VSPDLTPAQLAHVDQQVAMTELVLDELVSIAGRNIAVEGREMAAVRLVASMEVLGDFGRVATVGALALVRLAEIEGERRSVAEDVHADRTADAADIPESER